MVSRKPNRLIDEKSPYLLQHAYNPVDWYPWGEEAFKAAKEQNKPIFLSIGYSTCHWCHVMEKESFESSVVAEMMNRVFINIKVDREELPTVDSLYMEFSQNMVTGGLGWPLNVILTPDLTPFFATTYLPPYSSHGLIGLTEFTERIGEIWSDEEEREKLESQSEQIIQLFAKNIYVSGENLFLREGVTEAAELFFKIADPIYGGVQGEPKFPLSYSLQFLMDYSGLTKESRAPFIVERTLDMMHRGGIYDHLGGGFSRYSVDERWFLPHFEKMLYDNAMLAKTYFLGWRALKRPFYLEIADEIFHYLLRDLRHDEGGFFSAEDADSEGREGFFYTWPYEEVQEVLGPEGELFCEFYAISKAGNFEGRSLLHTKFSVEEFAKQKNVSLEHLEKQFKKQRQALWEVRERRIHPFKDKKIIASWNGLAIDALACAADAGDTKGYLRHAKQSAAFLKKHFWADGRLKRRWCDGESSFPGGLDDYAFLIKGLISIFEADGGTEWLVWAKQLLDVTDTLFKSPQGAYFQSSEEEKDLILRKCQYADGAEPSGNAIQCENLLRLYELSGDEKYLTAAEDVLKATERFLDHYPVGYVYHLMNFNRYYAAHRPTVIVALNDKESNRNDIYDLLHSHFIPYKSVIWLRDDDEVLRELLPVTQDKTVVDGKTTLYICHNGYCKKPMNELAEMEAVILSI